MTHIPLEDVAWGVLDFKFSGPNLMQCEVLTDLIWFQVGYSFLWYNQMNKPVSQNTESWASEKHSDGTAWIRRWEHCTFLTAEWCSRYHTRASVPPSTCCLQDVCIVNCNYQHCGDQDVSLLSPTNIPEDKWASLNARISPAILFLLDVISPRFLLLKKVRHNYGQLLFSLTVTHIMTAPTLFQMISSIRPCPSVAGGKVTDILRLVGIWFHFKPWKTSLFFFTAVFLGLQHINGT